MPRVDSRRGGAPKYTGRYLAAMAIRDWKQGQLAMLWAGGLLVVILLLTFASGIRPGLVVSAGDNSVTTRRMVADIVTLVAVLAVPGTLLVVSWKWFGARPK